MGIGQARVDPAHIPLAQPAIRLSGGARVVRPRFLIRTFIPHQCAPVGQGRDGLDRGLHLAEHHLSRPGRVGHEVLQGLPLPPGPCPVHVGKVPFGVHGQLGTQIVVGVLAGVARTGRKTAAKAQPELGEVVTQMGDRFRRQSPSSGGIQRWLAALIGLGRLVLRRLFPPMSDKPPQSSSGEALLQGPLGVRCHESILRTVAEHLRPSQRLREGLPRAIPHPYRSGLDRHQQQNDLAGFHGPPV